MEIALHISLSPEELTECRRKKIVEWVEKSKKSLEGKVDRLEIRIMPEAAPRHKNEGDQKQG